LHFMDEQNEKSRDFWGLESYLISSSLRSFNSK
jgi:hypothetical protein